MTSTSARKVHCAPKVARQKRPEASELFGSTRQNLIAFLSKRQKSGRFLQARPLLRYIFCRDTSEAFQNFVSPWRRRGSQPPPPLFILRRFTSKSNSNAPRLHFDRHRRMIAPEFWHLERRPMSSPFDLPLGARPGRDTPVGQDELGRTVYRTIRGTQYTIPEPVTMPAPSFGERAGMVGQAARGATLGGIFDVAKGLGRGVLEGIVQGVTAPRRALQGEPQTYGDVAATAGLGIFGAAPFQTGSSTLRSGIGRSGDPEAGIRAYHGSPHDFDRFRMDKIGTGEGAQAYGHGLYFAEAEPVARMYRDQISGADTAAARRTLQSFDGDVDRAISDTRAKLNRLEQRAAAGDFGGDERRFNAQSQIQKNKLDHLERFKETGEFSSGRMYEVNIAARPEQFLDWDMPLAGQTPEIQSAIRQIAPGAPGMASGQRLMSEIYPSNATPYTSAADRAQAAAAERLREAGIPGVRYLDEQSRIGGAQQTRNFVVFDENLISIVRKYGIAGAATMLGVTAADVQQALADNLPQSEWESLVVGE